MTSHSPDLLDDEDIDTDSILAVISEGGVTQIGALDETGKSALRDRLYTAGELLRLNQLIPEKPEGGRSRESQTALFEDRES